MELHWVFVDLKKAHDKLLENVYEEVRKSEA